MIIIVSVSAVKDRMERKTGVPIFAVCDKVFDRFGTLRGDKDSRDVEKAKPLLETVECECRRSSYAK